jgi:hypothetical protein
VKSVILLNVYVFGMFVFPSYTDYSHWTSSGRLGSFASCTACDTEVVSLCHGPAVTQSGSTRLANQSVRTSAGRVRPNEHFLQQQSWPNSSQRAPSTSHSGLHWFFFDFHHTEHDDYHMGQVLEHRDSSYCDHIVYSIRVFRINITTNSDYFSKQHSRIGLRNGEAARSLRSRNLICICLYYEFVNIRAAAAISSPFMRRLEKKHISP